MQKLVPLLMSSLSCFVLGSCKDVSLGLDGVGGSDGSNVAPTGGSGSNDTMGTGGSSGAGSGTCSGPNLIAHESNDYTLSATLTMVPVMVAPRTDLTFDWSEVTRDFSARVVDPPKDLNTILVLMWNLTPSAFQAKLNADSLQQRDLVTLPLTFTPDGNTTSANLLSFSHTGRPTPDVILSLMDTSSFPITNYVYTVMAATGNTIGEGTRMIQSFQLDPSSSNTTVKLTSSSTQLSYAVDLRNLVPATIPPGQAAITLDWGQLATDALGNPFVPGSITRAVVGHYTQPLSVLESQFPNLDRIADELYQADILQDDPQATSINFSSLKSSSGMNFPGIDGTGTWIVALQSASHRNPAPLYLSILKPCAN